MKIALETLGCKLNQAETETLARELAAAGHELVARSADADLFVLNTCTVTHTADAKARHLLAKVKRLNPNAILVATGCYAQRQPADLQKLADVVIDNVAKSSLASHLQARGILQKPAPPAANAAVRRRARAFVKIQDGCTNFCAYCIVPYVRGAEKSLPADEIIASVKKLAADYREIVLTGTRIGAYDDNGQELGYLVTRLLDETDIPRFRLSSLQPQEITPGLLELWHDPRLCPHFHLSLQSGSDTVLQRMGRLYDTALYARTVSLIRKIVPGVAITTDVIVGFPGETDAEFAGSLDFCRKMRFARIHVFMFSPRAGTKAAGMSAQVDEKVKKARSQQMLALAKASEQSFREQFSGDLTDVLWEKQNEDGQWSGVTGNYIRVYRRDKQDSVESTP